MLHTSYNGISCNGVSSYNAILISGTGEKSGKSIPKMRRRFHIIKTIKLTLKTRRLYLIYTYINKGLLHFSHIYNHYFHKKNNDEYLFSKK